MLLVFFICLTYSSAKTSFGLSIAAIGFFVACIVGVVYMNFLKKTGKLKVQEERKEIANDLNSDIYAPDEAPLTESVDKLTMQLGFIFGVYIFTYLFIFGLSFVAENERETMRQRQAEGIRIAKAKGVRFGRPSIETPVNFKEIVNLYRQKKITSSQAVIMSGLTRGTFYRKLNILKK